MNKHKTQTYTNPIFFFFFFINHSLCTDPWYEACVPMDCGDGVNITYPFFINGFQNSSCGYPGFGLNCTNGSSIIQLSGNNFTVKHINRTSNQIRLQNAAISSNPTHFCSSEIRNLTLDPNRFRLDESTTKKLVMISNCSGRISPELERYNIRSCTGDTKFVMAESDRNLRELMDGCAGGGEVVEVPVELDGGVGRSVVVDGGNYTEVVERGFLMRWLAADCGDCERSVGWCRFNTSCVCTYEQHKLSCKPGKGKQNHTIIILAIVGTAVIFALILGISVIRFKYFFRLHKIIV